jgi:hypothetical protein
MGYRMSLGCACEEGHCFLELDEAFATTIWMDNDGVLKQLGIATLTAVGGAGEEDEEVEIEPGDFVRWLDAVDAKHAAILDALRARGGRPRLWSAWQEREFAEAWKTYRELAQHAATEGVAVVAGWA